MIFKIWLVDIKTIIGSAKLSLLSLIVWPAVFVGVPPPIFELCTSQIFDMSLAGPAAYLLYSKVWSEALQHTTVVEVA